MEAGKGQQYKYVLFNSGLFQDIDPEMIDSEKGTLLDSVQFVVKEKVSQVVQKMAGDTEYTDVGADHVCIGLVYLNGYVVEFWRNTAANETLIFLNGVKVAEHEDIPGNETYFLDIDTNNETGELYITDGKQPPVIYRVNDLYDNILTAKYFADYDRTQYEINLHSDLSQPRFLQLEQLASFGGLLPGSYAYAMRYGSLTGDKTNWSQISPYIPVPVDYSVSHTPFVPGHRTYGSDASLAPTKFGIRLRIRVSNKSGYDFIELKRLTNNENTPITYTPRTQYIRLATDAFGEDIDIQHNPFTTLEFIDTHNIDWLTLDVDEVVENAPIKSAKTIRFVDGRLVLGGVEYESRVLTDEEIYIERSSRIAAPIKRRLEPQGYNLIHNQVYHKSNRLGERYGYGVKLIDKQGNALYTIPLQQDAHDFRNFKFPERRDAIPAGDLPLSTDPVETSTVLSNQGANVSETYEVADQGSYNKEAPTKEFTIRSGRTYNPLTPTGRGGGYVNNGSRYEGSVRRHVNTVEGVSYTPDNYNPSILATGLSIEGIDKTKLPEWVAGFSVVRTPAAGRVVCQGIGTYSLMEQLDTGGVAMRKRLNRLWFYSPELDSTIGDKVSLYDDIKDNPQNYKIQLVAPVGFNSEVYSARNYSSGVSHRVDMVSYANLHTAHGNVNPVDVEGDVGWGDGEVAFGRWRNQGESSTNMSPSIYSSTSKYIFGLSQATDVDIRGKNGRSNYLNLTLSANIYHTENIVGDVDTDDSAARNFHEPWYIVNIIRDGAIVADNNVNTYQEIGHYQKLNSLVGLSTGEEDFEVLIADERKEDYCPDYPLKGDASDDRYIKVDGQKWLCTNFRESETIDGWVTTLGTTGSFALNGETYYGLYEANLDRSERIRETAIPGTGETLSKIEFELSADFLNNPPTAPVLICEIRIGGTWYDVVYLYTFNQSDYTSAKGYQVIYTYLATHEATGLGMATSTDYQNLSTSNKVILRSFYPGSNYNFAMGYEFTSGQDGALEPDSVVITNYDPGTGGTIDEEIIIEGTATRNPSKITFPYDIPPIGAEIYIEYNSDIPLSVFLGDTVIDHSLFMALDCIDNDSPTERGNFRAAAPLPFKTFQFNGGYHAGMLSHSAIVTLGYLRQWAISFICESTVNLPFVYKNYFPHRQYVMRPYEFDTIGADQTVEDYLEGLTINANYNTDYPDEYLWWDYGGFHFPQGSNFDYQKNIQLRSFTRPKIGLAEVTNYPKRFHWGLQRNPSFVGTGAMRTFPPFNIYDLKNSKATGIKILYDIYTDKGSNLYAVTDRGVFLLLVGQRYLHDGQGDQSLLIREGTFISQEIPLNNYIGCPGSRWRGKAEGKVKLQGNQIVPVLIFPTENDIAVLQDNSVAEFGTNYLTTLQPVIEDITDGTQLASVVHTKENMFMFQVDNELYIYGFSPNNWLARVSLDYERLAYNNTTGMWVGTSNGKSYVESEGTGFASIGTQPCSISFVVNPGLGHSFEFTDMFLSASDTPDAITVAVTPEFTDPANIVTASIQTYAPGFFYIRFPKTAAFKMLKGKNLYVKLQYNDSEEPYTIKYCKVGFRKIAGG